jgi:hypothetical protein
MAEATADKPTHRDSLSHEDGAAPLRVLFEVPVDLNPSPDDEESFKYAAAVEDESSVRFPGAVEDDQRTGDDSAVEEDEIGLSAVAVSIDEDSAKAAMAATRNVDDLILPADSIRSRKMNTEKRSDTNDK